MADLTLLTAGKGLRRQIKTPLKVSAKKITMHSSVPITSPLSIFVNGFAIINVAETSLNRDSSPCQLGEAANDRKGEEGMGLREAIVALSAYAREWFLEGVLREAFHHTIENDPSFGGHAVQVGYHLKLKEVGGTIGGNSNTSTSPETATSSSSDGNTDSSSHYYHGVESFVVRLPLSPCSIFPWPITMPSLEKGVTTAFNAFEALGWHFFTRLMQDIVAAKRENLNEQDYNENLNEQDGHEGEDYGHQSFAFGVHEIVRRLREAQEGTRDYSDSILFLRRYIGAKPMAHPHTDSGIVTLIPFQNTQDIKGLEVHTCHDKAVNKMAGAKGDGEGANAWGQWLDVADVINDACGEKGGDECRCVVLLGEMGEAILRGFMPVEYLSDACATSCLPSCESDHVPSSLSSLHRVRGGTYSGDEGNRGPRITTPFQLRVPFTSVPGFIGFDANASKAIAL